MQNTIWRIELEIDRWNSNQITSQTSASGILWNSFSARFLKEFAHFYVDKWLSKYLHGKRANYNSPQSVLRNLYTDFWDFLHCKVLPLFAQGVFEGVALILLVSFARQIQFFPGTFLPEGDWALSKCEWKLFDWWGGRICCEEAKCWSSISQTYPCFCRSAYTCIFYTF